MATDILTRHNIHQHGTGPTPMLFAHGFGCDQNMWRFVEPAFRADYRTVLFDHIGAGKSERAAYRPDRYASLTGYADDLLALCDALDLRQVVLVGHSVSAMIGVLATAREPARFARLILICPSPRYINDPPDYIGGFERADIEELLATMERNHLDWAQFLAPVVMKNAEQPALAAELEQSFCATDPAIARQFARVTFLADNRRDLALVKTASLILQCAEDSIAPTAVGRYVHAQLRGSTLAMLRATGHCPHMSAPEETIAAMRAWLKAP